MADCENKHALVYLASPYSNEDPEIRAFRADMTARVMAAMLDRGVNVFSPIVCMEGLRKFRKGEPCEYEAWDSICEAMIERCDSFTVLAIDGWKKSVGIKAEMAYARELGKPIRGVDISGRPVKID